MQMLDRFTIPIAITTDYDAVDNDWQTEIRVQGTYLKAAGIDLSTIDFEWSAFDYEYDVFDNIQKCTGDPKASATQAVKELLEKHDGSVVR